MEIDMIHMIQIAKKYKYIRRYHTKTLNKRTGG